MSDSRSTVVVACRMPHGLRLRLHKMVDRPEPMPMGGTHVNKIAQQVGDEIVLRGYLDKYKVDLPPAARGSDYGLTFDVPKEFMDEWWKQNQDLDAVKNNLIFYHEKVDTVQGMVKDRRPDTRSGLEPIDPEKLKGPIRSYDKNAN